MSTALKSRFIKTEPIPKFQGKEAKKKVKEDKQPRFSMKAKEPVSGKICSCDSAPQGSAKGDT